MVAAQQAEVQKGIEAEATNRAEELVKVERENQKRKSDPEEDATNGHVTG